MAKTVNGKNGKGEVKETTKKVMKAEEPKVDFTTIRKMFNVFLQKHAGKVTLTENKHGAIQVRRPDTLLFSARSDGKMIISHPIFEGKERVFAHPGVGYLDRSQVPFEKVTPKMLDNRFNDPKSQTQYTEAVYAKKPEECGTWQKAEAAKARVKDVKKDTKAKTEKAKATLREAKESKKAKKAPKIVEKAIRRVVEAKA